MSLRSLGFVLGICFAFASIAISIAVLVVFWNVMQSMIELLLHEKMKKGKSDELIGLSFISLTIIVF